jgi:anti-sigma B factor antagonist
MLSAMPFMIDGAVDTGGVARVAMEGELDLAAVPLLYDRIGMYLASDAVTEVLVDLSAATFLDSSGIGALIGCLRQADRCGKTFHVANAHGRVREVLDLTNVTTLLTIGPTPRSGQN